jgi:hypothetical protein
MLPYLARTSLTFSISLGMSSWRRSLSDWAETADEAENWRAELERICCCQYVLRRDETRRCEKPACTGVWEHGGPVTLEKVGRLPRIRRKTCLLLGAQTVKAMGVMAREGGKDGEGIARILTCWRRALRVEESMVSGGKGVWGLEKKKRRRVG